MVAASGCGRSPAPDGSPGATPSVSAPGSTKLPAKAEVVAALNARPGLGSFIRAVDATIEPAGAPEPGSGRQAIGYRATYELTEDLFTQAPLEPLFARLKMNFPRWEAAGRLRRETLRPETLRAAHLEGGLPKDLVALHRVIPRGQRYTVWGRMTAVREVDRWEFLDIATGRIEPPLPEGEADPRGAFVDQHPAAVILAEDEDAALRQWGQSWEDYSVRVDAAGAAQGKADAPRIARYRQNPTDYLLPRRWILGTIKWDPEVGQSRFEADAPPGRFEANPRLLKVGSDLTHTDYDWQMEADGALSIDGSRNLPPRNYRLSEVRVIGDHQLALVEARQPGSPFSLESKALVEEAHAPGGVLSGR